MKMFRKFLVIYWFFTGLILSHVIAADNDAIVDTFQTAYYSSYQEGQCGPNIDGFLKKLVQSRLDISGLLLVHIDGGGDLWAYSTRNEHGSPDRSVWFHHYIMLLPPKNLISSDMSFSIEDVLHYEVIDFDFLNQPTVIKFKEYLGQMFIPASIRNNPEKIQKDFSLGIIKFDFVDAEKYSQSWDPSLNANQARDLRNNSLVKEKIKFKEIYR